MTYHECPLCRRTITQGWSWRRAFGVESRHGLCAACAVRTRAEHVQMYQGMLRIR